MDGSATRPQGSDGRRETRWLVLPLRLCAAAAILGCGLISASDFASADERPRFHSDAPDRGGKPIDSIGPLREGYTTLWWDPTPDAAAYELTDDAGTTIYRGHLPQAFVSGLSDGEHVFTVAPIDEDGEWLASDPLSITVTVEHWGLRFALLLLTIGAIVVAALVGVLAVGSWLSHTARRSHEAAANRSATNPGASA